MSENLQFEKAEYADASAATACAMCQSGVTDSYYAVGDRILCAGCAERVRNELANQGSRFGRVGRSIGAGMAAAALGTLVYYAVLALTGYEFGLIAIVVGYAVGMAVRWGSRRRGGWAYQGLAMTLTYLSIVSAYVPMIIHEIRTMKVEKAGPATAGHAGASQSASATPVAQTTSSQGADEKVTFAQFLLAISVLVLFACAAPFLAGLQNIIGLIIIGVGLYEAWKLNRHVSFEITGPHPVSTSASPAL